VLDFHPTCFHKKRQTHLHFFVDAKHNCRPATRPAGTLAAASRAKSTACKPSTIPAAAGAKPAACQPVALACAARAQPGA
jgi:hypothetical protein